MFPEKDQVQGSSAEGVSAPAETPDQGGVAKATPNQQPVVDVEKLKAEYEGRLQKYETDLNQMKSTLQRREAQVTKEWQERYGTVQKQLHEARMSKMTDEERARYERQLESEEYQTLQSKVSEMENEIAMKNSTFNAFQFFLSQGVPAEKLNIAEGYDVIVATGWEHLTTELARLREAASNPNTQTTKPKTELAPLKDAPDVITDKGVPGGGTSWQALRAAYGTDEAVYRAVEEGRLPSSVIPT